MGKNGDLVQGMELLLYNQEDRKRENMFEKKAVLRLSLEDHYLHFIGALENSPLRSFIKFSKQTKKKWKLRHKLKINEAPQGPNILRETNLGQSYGGLENFDKDVFYT